MKKLFTVLAVLLVATALFAQVGLTVKAGGAYGFDSYKTGQFKDKDGDELEGMKDFTFKTKGFGFDIGVQYDITDKLLAYADFNMLFPKDLKSNIPFGTLLCLFADPDIEAILEADEDFVKKYFNEDGDLLEYSLNGIVEDAKKILKAAAVDLDDYVTISSKSAFFSISAGVAYKLDFNAVKLNVGGGITVNKASESVNLDVKEVAVPTLGAKKIEEKFSLTTLGLNAMVEAKYLVAENIGLGVTLLPQLGLYNKAVLDEKITLPDDSVQNASFVAKGFKVSFAMPIVVGVSYTF